MELTPSRSTPLLTRRRLLQSAGFGILNVSALAKTPPLFSASTPGVEARLPLHRFPRMMHAYFGARIVENERRAEERVASLQTRAEAEAYVREITAQVASCFGPLPERTPLKARITGVLEREGYTVEKIIFESRPNFPVTGNLYLPRKRRGPTPAVLGVCGHNLNAKAAPNHQNFCQGLVKLGYIALIIDPVGQGERYQHVDDRLEPIVGGSVREHLHVGNPQFLVGEFLGTWMAWDAIRAFDYLLTRPEVDGQRIMVTGASGGGTQTTWMGALDPRLWAAAPCCFINSLRRMFESEQPADTEQCPPRALALGLDHADFLIPFIPRHQILLGQEKDPFDVRGLEETYARLRRLYSLMGAESQVDMYIGPDGHGYFQKNREAMYRWFNHATGWASTHAEPAITLEKDEDLWCTPQGQVAPLQPLTVLAATREASQQLRAQRRSLTGEALRHALISVLRLPERRGVADYRILPRSGGSRAYPKRFAGHYAVETEPGILAIVYRLSDTGLASRLPRGPKRAVLYVSHRSADAELRDEPLIREVMAADPEAAVFACDVRGIGESEPNTTSQTFTNAYGSDYFYAIYGIMFDQPYPGRRAFDLLRVLDWLRAHGHEEVHLVAKGWGTIPATFAAVLSESVTRVTLKHALTSYTEVAEATDYDWPLSVFVPDILKTLDLPDCYRALASKGLRQIEPRGAMAKL